MAYYAALASLQSTLEKFIGQDPFQILDDEDNKQGFDFLKQNIELLLDFLDNFPGSAPQLEKKIAHSAEEAECMIEKYVWQNRGKRGKVSFLDFLLKKKKKSKLLLPIRDTAITFKSILGDLEGIKTKSIAEDGSRSKGKAKALSHPESEIRKTTGVVLGFDDELARVKDLILYGDSELVSIPIVGMGGVGKTTLAKAAFDDHAVVDRFDVRRWVTVSQAYDSRAILLTILNNKSSHETASLQQLSVEVHQLLHRRRFIIVVDDIWSLDAWDKVKRFFPDNNGSRILLTTRDQAVASYADVSSTAIHHLRLMDEERSWRLFERRLFGEGVCCPPELVELGKKIAQGCKGLPLAIVVVVGILSTIEQTPDSWKRIAGDVNMTLSKGSSEYFSEILWLSYHHLPHFLKPCFLYLSAFPEDYYIDVEKVIRMWVAEGFLRAKPGKLAEDIAYGYLEDLAKRNLIMVREMRYGKITKCGIHDLLRDLCVRQAEEQKFIYHNKDGIFSEGISEARRISITSRVSSRSMNLGEFSLHTTFCFVQKKDHDIMDRLMSMHWKLLRVLDMKEFALSKFPPELFQLYHLRYLAASYVDITGPHIEEGISNLENLETFMVNSYPTSRLAFRRFWTMKNLRHAEIFDLRLPIPRSQRFPLENLLTLSKLHNFCCSKKVVELIPNLKTIYVKYNLDWELLHYYHLNNFCRFRNLESFTFEIRFEYIIFKNPLVGCLVLPSSLRRLTIVEWGGCILWEGVSAAIGSLPNLEYLKFQCVRFCGGDVWETREGDFQNLRMLEMEVVDLKRWIIESSSHFPNLERLVLSDCHYLTEVPDCIGDIATLHWILVDRCSEVINEWARRIREEQREMGNEILKIVV